jgi:hypothetical protein
MFVENAKTATKIGIIGLFAFIISIVVSFTTGEITPYPNIEVPSKFVQFVPEVSKSGKHEYHNIYAEFQTPDGNIILDIPEGFPINNPQTLYKN